MSAEILDSKSFTFVNPTHSSTVEIWPSLYERYLLGLYVVMLGIRVQQT